MAHGGSLVVGSLVVTHESSMVVTQGGSLVVTHGVAWL